jgi:hypothetical protein
LLVFVPLLAGVVLVERLIASGLAAAVRRQFLVIGGLVAMLHVVALWFNARRYAVGTDGPALFVGHSAWVPPGGWEPWLLTGAAGALLLGVVVVRSCPSGSPLLPVEVAKRVER